MRCCSTSNDGRPASSRDDDLAVDHRVHLVDAARGPCAARGTGSWRHARCACAARSRPSRARATHRMPSSFGSNHHAGSSKASHPPSASIGSNRGGAGISGAVLCAREEGEPVGPRLHEVELEPGVAPAVQHERDLRVGPLDRLVPCRRRRCAPRRRRSAPRGSCPRTRRTRADAPRSAPRAACRPSRSAAPSAPPTTAARRRARAARRSAGASRGACGSRTSCQPGATSPGAGSVVPSGPKSRRAHVLEQRRVLRGGGDLLGGRPRPSARPCGAGARRRRAARRRPPGRGRRRAPRGRSVRSAASVRTPVEQVADALESLPHVVDAEVAAARTRPRTPRPTRAASTPGHAARAAPSTRRRCSRPTGSCCGR